MTAAAIKPGETIRGKMENETQNAEVKKRPTVEELERLRDDLLEECHHLDCEINAAREAEEREAEAKVEIRQSTLDRAVQEATAIERRNQVLSAENAAYNRVLSAIERITGGNRHTGYGEALATLSGIGQLQSEFEAKAKAQRAH